MNQYIKMILTAIAVSFLSSFFIFDFSKWWAILFAVPFGMFANEILPDETEDGVSYLFYGAGIIICAVAIHIGQHLGLVFSN